MGFDMAQKDIFSTLEGDAWFERNKHGYDNRSINEDPIFIALKNANITPKRILEIGCSNGWRLEQLAQTFKAEAFGVDPSIVAINHGRKRHYNVALYTGTADDLPLIEPVDLIIFGFCLYLCDPLDLFRIAEKCNAALSDKGIIAIMDFRPPNGHYRNEYIHRDNIYSYKMNYGEMFCWHPSYYRIYEHIQNHAGIQSTHPDELISVQLIRKDNALLNASNPYMNINA